MAAILLSLGAGSNADAASRSIRITARVPVFCGLVGDGPPHGTIHHRHGWPGHGKFKIRCNTPYRMHMDGEWDPPGWPHRHGEHKEKKDIDVALRVFDRGNSRQALCALVKGKKQSCRGFDEDDGAGAPPRLAQAQLTIDAPPSVVRRGRDEPHVADAGDSGLFGRIDGRPPRWEGRMSLGALPRVASAGALTYLPNFVDDAGKSRDVDRAAFDFDDEDDEQITLFLTLTGRY